MATASEIERIIVELETQGADGAYVGVKRLDDAMKSLSKHKGPSGIAESFEALSTLDDRLTNSLVEVPGLADKAAAAWSHLVGQVRAYNESQVRKAMRNTDLEASRRDAQQLLEQMAKANRTPTELQAASNPKSISFAEALASQSQKAGSAIQAASHSAMEEAAAIGQAAQAASKLSSVYDVVEKRAKAAATADKRWLSEQMAKANRIPTELQAASNPKALTSAQKAFQSISKIVGPKATESLVSAIEGLEKYGPTLAKVGAVASKVASPILAVGAAIAAVGVGVAGAAVFAAKEFGGAVVNAQGFKDNMVDALNAITGSQSKSDAILERAATTADYLRKGRAETLEQFAALSNRFDLTTTDRIVRGMADLKVKSPKANIEGLVMAIGQIKLKGKLAGEELLQLAENGLDQGKVIDALAAKAGKSADTIRKEMQAGKIEWKEGIDAILGSINPRGEALGSIASKKARNNINDLIDSVKQIPQNILFDIKVGTGMDNIKATLNTIIDWFDPEKGKGKEVRKVGGDLFNALVEGLTGNKVDTSKGITATLDAILNGAKEAVPTVREAGAAIRDIVGAIAELGKNGDVKTLMAMTQAFIGLGAIGPSVLTSLKEAGKTDILGSIGASLSSIGSSIASTASSIMSQAYQIGSNLWQGLVNGITSGISMVTQAATNLANSALRAVGLTWRVGSPAKAFEEQSMWAGAGSVQGFNKMAPKVAGAAAGMAYAGLGAAWAAGQANVNGGASVVPLRATSTGQEALQGSPSVVVHFSPQIVVSGAASTEQAQVVGNAAVRGARAAFESQYGSALRRVAGYR